MLPRYAAHPRPGVPDVYMYTRTWEYEGDSGPVRPRDLVNEGNERGGSVESPSLTNGHSRTPRDNIRNVNRTNQSFETS